MEHYLGLFSVSACFWNNHKPEEAQNGGAIGVQSLIPSKMLNNPIPQFWKYHKNNVQFSNTANLDVPLKLPSRQQALTNASFSYKGYKYELNSLWKQYVIRITFTSKANLNNCMASVLGFSINSTQVHAKYAYPWFLKDG